MLPATAVNLPLLGSRIQPEATFQYLLDELNGPEVVFSCPGWLAGRGHFRTGDRLDLHLPFRNEDGWHRQVYEIAEVSSDPVRTGQVCRCTPRQSSPLHHPVCAAIENGEFRFRSAAGELLDADGLVRDVLKDCLLQKRGIGVYFKHLVPLFSRITLFPTEDYGALRSMLLEDIRRRIEANIAALGQWHGRAAGGELTADRLAGELDLETLRGAVEPEIEGEVFNATFDNPTIAPYLGAIRLLEKKLCLNYNTLVLLYARSLGPAS